MQEALVAVGLLVVATIIGIMLKPGEDQLRPLTPQVSSGDDHGHDHGHGDHHH